MNGTKQTTWFAHIIHMYHRICGIIPYSYVWCLGDITRSWCWCHRSPPVQQPRGVWGRSISARVMRWGMLKYPYIWRLTNPACAQIQPTKQRRDKQKTWESIVATPKISRPGEELSTELLILVGGPIISCSFCTLRQAKIIAEELSAKLQKTTKNHRRAPIAAVPICK